MEGGELFYLCPKSVAYWVTVTDWVLELLELLFATENVLKCVWYNNRCSRALFPSLSVDCYIVAGDENLYYPEMPTRPVSSMLPVNSSLSRSVPGLAQATQPPPEPRQKQWGGGGGGGGGWNIRWDIQRGREGGREGGMMSDDAWTIQSVCLSVQSSAYSRQFNRVQIHTKTWNWQTFLRSRAEF